MISRVIHCGLCKCVHSWPRSRAVAPLKPYLRRLNTGTNATKSTVFGNSSILQIAWTSPWTSSIQALHGSVALPGPGGVKSPVSALPACSCHPTAPHHIKWLFRKTLRKWLKKICTLWPACDRRARRPKKRHVRHHRTALNESMWCSARLIPIWTMCPFHNIWAAARVFAQGREALLFLWLDNVLEIKSYGL